MLRLREMHHFHKLIIKHLPSYYSFKKRDYKKKTMLKVNNLNANSTNGLQSGAVHIIYKKNANENHTRLPQDDHSLGEQDLPGFKEISPK